MTYHSWQPIETAPKDGTAVDLWVSVTFRNSVEVRDSRFPDCRWEDGKGWFDPYGGPAYDQTGDYLIDDECRTFRVTHWMSVPCGPVEEKT